MIIPVIRRAERYADKCVSVSFGGGNKASACFFRKTGLAADTALQFLQQAGMVINRVCLAVDTDIGGRHFEYL